MNRACCLAVVFGLVAPAGGAGQGRRIIDVHVHAQELWVPPGSLAEDAGIPRATGLRAPASGAEVQAATLAAFDELGIELAIVSGERAELYRAQAPDRILASPMLTGTDVPVDSVRSWFSSDRFQALAEFAPQYSGLTPDAPELEPYFALAEEFDVPVGIHMGPGPPGAAYNGSPAFRMADANPMALEPVLVAHPALRVFVMHAGWPFLDEMVGLLYGYPQLYVDIGVINWILPRPEFHQYLRRLVDAGFGDRIMFGSDQMVWPGAIAQAIEAVESADFLTESQKDDIFFNNAARFLRLSDASGGPS